jgi:hypothetical protein
MTPEKKLRRAILLLEKEAGCEAQSRPLVTLSDLVARGLAERRPYTSFWNGRLYEMFETTLTSAGRAAAQAIRGEGNGKAE